MPTRLRRACACDRYVVLYLQLFQLFNNQTVGWFDLGRIEFRSACDCQFVRSHERVCVCVCGHCNGKKRRQEESQYGIRQLARCCACAVMSAHTQSHPHTCKQDKWHSALDQCTSCKRCVHTQAQQPMTRTWQRNKSEHLRTEMLGFTECYDIRIVD